jgi:hypothetical protein
LTIALVEARGCEHVAVETVSVIVAAIAPLVGVALGALLSSSVDSRKWRRDWLAATVGHRREFHSAAILALEDLFVLLRQFAEAQATHDKASAPSNERISDSTWKWRQVLSRRYVEAMEPLQNALVVFDQARDAVVRAMNAHDASDTSATLAGLTRARASVLNAVNLESCAINLELAEFDAIGRGRNSRRRFHCSVTSKGTAPANSVFERGQVLSNGDKPSSRMTRPGSGSSGHQRRRSLASP